MAIPITIFAQNWCFATQEEGEVRLNSEIFECYGNGGVPDINIVYQNAGTYEGSWCVAGTCHNCSAIYDQVVNIATEECCQRERLPKTTFNHYRCISPILSSGAGVNYSNIQGDIIPDDILLLCTDQVSKDCIDPNISSSSTDEEDTSSSSTNEEENSSSSGDGGGGSSGSGGGEEDDDDDYSSCFLSFVDAMIVNMERTAECTASGGDASALEIVLQDDVWCLAGSCDCPDSVQPMHMLRAAVQRTAVNSCEVPSSSSGGEGGSSSSGDEISSSSSDGESSSSSEAGNLSSDSGYGYIGSCQIPDSTWKIMSSYGVFKRVLYSSNPGVRNANNIRVSSCSCGSNGIFFGCRLENFGYVHDYTVYDLPLCGYSHGYWCNGIESDSCNFSGSSAYIYYTDSPGYDWLVQGLADPGLFPLGSMSSYFELRDSIGNSRMLFHHNFILPSNISTFDLENAILSALPDFPSLNRLNEYCRGEWVPHDEDCFGTQPEVLEAVNDSADACGWLGGSPRYAHELSGRGWCVVGECEFNGISSSSVEEVSSSSSEDVGSSSSESSGCIEPPGYVSLPDGINTCIKKDNRCYVCNPDRGADCGLPWLWTGEQVNQEYWFKEVGCSEGAGESSSSSEEVCPSHPLLSVPSNPLNACFEKNGSCYKCNSERGSECGNNWLWIYDFVESNVGYWYEEIDCGTSNFRSMFLAKKNLPETGKSSKEDISNEVWGNKTKFYYDALGRRTQAEPNTRRFLVEKKGK